MRKLVLLLALSSTQAAATNWEYSSFLSGYGDGYVWLAPGEKFFENKPEDIYIEMGCGKIKTHIELLNCIGSKGWELVTIIQDKSTPQHETFFFKRPKQ